MEDQTQQQKKPEIFDFLKFIGSLWGRLPNSGRPQARAYYAGVMPIKGISHHPAFWIPAYAGMTMVFSLRRLWLSSEEYEKRLSAEDRVLQNYTTVCRVT